MSWSRVLLSEIPAVDQGGGRLWHRVRHHFGIEAFGVNAWTSRDAGGELINQHSEEGGHEELYVVLTGRTTFTVGGKKVDAPAGALVFVQPELVRSAVAEEPGTTVLVVGGTPGEAFHVSGWELWAPADEHYRAGDYDRAIEVTVALLEEHPDDAGLLYNLACCESLAGGSGEALEHLRRACELERRFVEYARRDSDFDAIRADPRFSAIAGEPDAAGASP